ncbi:MAG TPA: Holliday junction resolvase-like protein, partial [Candidatus Nanoarchaeia archaeon]|nr:Holliday junction resolvase-like protein [Candidatus Nanoarchaeia archaeon]
MDLLTIIFLILCLIIGYFIGQKIGILKRDKHWESQLPGHRKDAIMKSRAVLSGFFSEQLSPYLPDFPFNPNEVRFIGKPVDFLVFKGMDEKKIDEVVFVEVKSGNSNLNKIQKSLKDAIENKKVRWEEYRVPDN